ncbi:MAG: endonuclease III [SAR324 cluster bacterium]|jgi:endonuclease-3|nr:endonuclease III [Deltaproteobacteria bacterium]MDP6216164.1 endonuclease III [SAR324 cluster bacterium]RZO45788.1 MAG: endonuclease III [Pseudomonadota bacterium]MDP6319134.1 endonuclease III [SAR324 cluster bacterium]MDP6888157.1 endonuclease III [SAR324 cluster bacterium]|tara:strand:+ start:65 stop:688 length:624 start_codon:yes stop_codon:yes gene_type:complete
MKNTKVESLFRKLSNSIPKAETELFYRNTFELLIAVILSAQATDISVNKVTPKLFAAFPTPEKMYEAGAEKVLSYIRSIGLAPTKSKNIVTACAQLIENHASKVPGSREQLEALAGVGRKTANVILNTAFGQPVIAVDTHIFRISNRTGLAPGNTVLQVEENLMKAVPEKWKKDAHHLLILHGRYVCKSRNPDCECCVIFKECKKTD